MNKLLLVATATTDLPVAEDVIRQKLGNIARLETVPLPFHSLADEPNLPSWFSQLETADALLVRSGIVDEWLISRLKNCRVIALHGVGVDQVDVEACSYKGIVVTNVPGANARAAAELTLGLILDSLRHISRADRLLRNGNWEAARFVGKELGGQRVGVIGLGNIGLKVAHLCQAFGASVAFYDIDCSRTAVTGLPWMPLHDLLRWATVVTVHVPLTPQTRGLLSHRELTLIGSGGVLVNVARGPVVDQKALAECLEAGQLGWAACDVFDVEPPNLSERLFSMQRATFTPHIGGSTEECLAAIARAATEDIVRVWSGSSPVYWVNKP